MSNETPDYAALAKRYMDLWQEQIGGLARDPAQLSDVMASWSKIASEMLRSTGGANEFHAAAHRTAAAAPSSGRGSVDLTDVLRRLDAIERRLAAMEPTSRKRKSIARKKRAKRPGKKRS